MKKSIFLITIFFLVLKTSLAAHEGVGTGGMVIDRESFGGGASGMVASGGGGVSNYESMGTGGTGRIMENCPGSYDIGGFDRMRTLDLPTSYVGNFGGSF